MSHQKSKDFSDQKIKNYLGKLKLKLIELFKEHCFSSAASKEKLNAEALRELRSEMSKKQSKITSKHLKAALLANFRFVKQYPIITTEAGLYHADVVALNPLENKYIEVEIKISKSDLLADLKKLKHHYYKINQGDFIPHQFFYCVPADLVDIALEMIKDLPYGLIKYRGLSYHRSCKSTEEAVIIIKRAKKLHDGKIQDHVINTIQYRMASELAQYAVMEVLKN